MPRNVGHLVDDILEAIARIERLTAGKTFEDFDASWELQWLIQRGIEVISEASRGIPDKLKALQPEIPWRRVSGIGNVLRHDYDGLSNRILWNVVEDELPKLRRAVEAIRSSDQSNPA
ncbi:MAG: DUF86 domain-containing protein [Xanthobacteraceae bacterium]|nr:DUF86 domain-containing protein [Xanthobacteraceae bacterium]